MHAQELARALFDAFTVGDESAIRTCCAPAFEGQQNFGPPMDLDTLIGFTLSVLAVTRDFRYEDIVCTETVNGFVEEHRVCATLPDGAQLRLAACVVAEVDAGRVLRLREYLDTAAAAPLMKALAAGSKGQAAPAP